jgi:uncharacterized protein YPO0396
MTFESALQTSTPARFHEGYRLHRLEVYNWGTFHDSVWQITPRGSVSLLTGANGSGKSTLVDALITLIVPPVKRGYNLASGSEGRKRGERNVDSYFYGEYGRTRTDEQDSVLRLRGRNNYSVLVAIFHNAVTDKTVTLAQLLHAGDSSKAIPLHIVAERELSIQEHFNFDGDVRAFRKRMSGQGCRVYDEFSKYSGDFKRLFGLRSDNALELFNKIVSMKEIGRLNDFVRDYMLEPINLRERIENLYRNYQNLNEMHGYIQRDQHALEHLVPLDDLSTRRDTARHEQEAARRCVDVVPAYTAYLKGQLLDSEIQRLQTDLQTMRAELDAAKAKRTIKQEERDSLRLSIDSDNVGSQITALKKDINNRKEVMQPKIRRANAYNPVALALGLRGYSDLPTFQHNQEQARQQQADLAQRIAALDSALREHQREEERAQSEIDKLRHDLEELERSKNNLSPNLIRVRRQIAAELGIEETELPFIGELLQVRQEDADWEAAIEKLLHGYAQQLLVTPALYHRVRRTIDGTTLNTKLVYNVVREHHQRPERPRERELVVFKLDMNKEADRQFTTWLSNELVLRWGYACVNDVQNFDQWERAITINGQIKHSSTRHEKDDRGFGDRSSYLLGWDNRAKIAAIRAKLAAEQEQHREARKQITAIQGEQARHREQQRDLDDLLRFTDFDEIDWRPDQAQIDNWQEKLRELERSSSIQQLRQQLEAVETELAALDTNIERYQAAIGGMNSKLQFSEGERDKCQQMVDARPADADDYAERIETYIAGRYRGDITLTNIDTVTREAQSFYSNSAASYLGQATIFERDIAQRLTAFHKDKEFAEFARELDDHIDALPDYLRLKVRLEQDDLPKHREGFRAMMNENIAQDIIAFREELTRKVEEYRERIETLNAALRRIAFSDLTKSYIQIKHDDPSSTGEINRFKADLNAAIPNQMRPEMLEEYFEPIRKLIERLRTETEWQKRVTDPRYWLDYYAREYGADGTPGEIYSDSSGKSGGQKAKLAYTVLASAIADQYGINQDSDDAAHAFRFVAVDEVFSKLDEGNARFAMQLFEQLHLQVLVVTPMDKMHIVEPYIGAVHIISNPDGNESTVLDFPIEEYRNYRNSETEQP